jgi:hypothetical protein
MNSIYSSETPGSTQSIDATPSKRDTDIAKKSPENIKRLKHKSLS